MQLLPLNSGGQTRATGKSHGSRYQYQETEETKMKKLHLAFTLAAFTTLSTVAVRAQETREQAAAHLRTPDPNEMDPKFTKAAPFAQKLVDEALAKHPQVLLLAIASNFGRIGKLGDEDDLRCIHTGKDNLEVNKEGNHYEDQTPLRDQSGKIIGAIGVVFSYKPGDDKLALQNVAKQIRDEMKAQSPDAKRLFGPA
jgi:hypothetical protein